MVVRRVYFREQKFNPILWDLIIKLNSNYNKKRKYSKLKQTYYSIIEYLKKKLGIKEKENIRN